MNWHNANLVLGMIFSTSIIVFAFFFQGSSPFVLWSWKNSERATRWVAMLCWPATIFLGLCANWWLFETPWTWWKVGIATLILGYFVVELTYKNPRQWRLEKASLTRPSRLF